MPLFTTAVTPEETVYALGCLFAKSAAATELSYGLAGRLYLSQSGWLLLHVPNSFVHGLFDALNEPGVEKPNGGEVNAHISVMTADEVEQVGATNITERGQAFRYTLGPLRSVKPHGQGGVYSRVWFVEVQSPQLKALRKSYGLSALPHEDHEFHITVAYRRKSILLDNDLSKAAEDAKGIPDRKFYGDLTKIAPNSLVDFVIQRHLAERAGPHFDFRFGDPQGLYSFATRRTLPSPGGRVAWHQQPMHSYKYKDWEGTIPAGQYGAGRVQKLRDGQLLFTKVTPNSLHFTTADTRYPERFALIKPDKWKDTDWLLLNTTPTQAVPYSKVRYKRIPADQVEEQLQKMRTGDSAEAKVDGASSLIRLLKDGVELTSYRQSSETGRPIIHTERFFHGLPDIHVPQDLVGSVLKGEIYGVQSAGADRGRSVRRDGAAAATDATGSQRVISPQELGGILNSTLAKSIATQQQGNITLRNMVYDIQQLGNKSVAADMPRETRRQLIQKILGFLPADKFHISESADSPEEAQKLWQRIQTGQHPLTSEGVVIWPHEGVPLKGKLTEDYDVYLRNVFPGEGRLRDNAAGGFEYSLSPQGPILGRVGTGLSDQLRQDLWQNPAAYQGRVARIRSQEQLPSGAFRAPALLAFHEDLPTGKTAAVASPEEITVTVLQQLDILRERL